jgi:Uma2 family endonuclease
MSHSVTTSPNPGGEVPARLPRLEAGDELDQPTFHARYSAMPPGFRAELVEGSVIVASPTKMDYAECHPLASFWLSLYRAATPGIRLVEHQSMVLGPGAEVQPDAALLLDPDCGGKVRIESGLVYGAPELAVEIASSSESYDLHSKLRDYQRAGVGEYVVFAVRNAEVHWFVLSEGRLRRHDPDPDRIYRSTVFPGLWRDSDAVFRIDYPQVARIVQLGLAHPSHAEFVGRLGRRDG